MNRKVIWSLWFLTNGHSQRYLLLLKSFAVNEIQLSSHCSTVTCWISVSLSEHGHKQLTAHIIHVTLC